MKLYFTPGACSPSPHIVLREAGIDADLEQVDLKTKKTKSGTDYTTVNPKGQVPTLMLDNGQTLTEGRRSYSISPTKSRNRGWFHGMERSNATGSRNG